MIPQEEHPDINFVGLLIGPRGNTLKCKFHLKYRENADMYYCSPLLMLQRWRKKLGQRS